MVFFPGNTTVPIYMTPLKYPSAQPLYDGEAISVDDFMPNVAQTRTSQMLTQVEVCGDCGTLFSDVGVKCQGRIPHWLKLKPVDLS